VVGPGRENTRLPAARPPARPDYVSKIPAFSARVLSQLHAGRLSRRSSTSDPSHGRATRPRTPRRVSTPATGSVRTSGSGFVFAPAAPGRGTTGRLFATDAELSPDSFAKDFIFFSGMKSDGARAPARDDLGHPSRRSAYAAKCYFTSRVVPMPVRPVAF